MNALAKLVTLRAASDHPDESETDRAARSYYHDLVEAIEDQKERDS